MAQTEEPILETNAVPFLDANAFKDSCGESIDTMLDMDTWERDPDLAALCRRIEEEVGDAVETENQLGETTRREIISRIATRPGAPAGAGVYRATSEQLQRVCRQVLFNGAIEVCDGTMKEFETLPVTITQIGVCLASYQGGQQSFAHRLYQRDLRVKSGDVLQDLLDLMDNRAAQAGSGGPSKLFRRGLMAYAERAALVQKSKAPWRMGHGSPAPYELLTGSGSMELLERSLSVLRTLVTDCRRFVFIPSEDGDKRLITLGYGLRAGEYAVVQTARDQMERIVNNGHYSKLYKRMALNFCDEAGPQIVMGVYRASAGAPPFVFYSHVDHSHEAALIVMADSLLQEYRGFPLLIDLADRLCRAAFGNDIFDGAIHSAYARANAPFRFFGERQTRG